MEQKKSVMYPEDTVCILNHANANTPGGGWKNGRKAQEECLCFRSSLFFTLKSWYYPLPLHSGIFSPRVVIIRDGPDKGWALADNTKQRDQFHVVSAITIAAINRPKLKVDKNTGQEIFADPQERETTRRKLRSILRIAALRRQRKLILGAFGCGAFYNPPNEVAEMWREVLLEKEFSGGWWEEIVFAVLDPPKVKDGNFPVFKKVLNGLSV